MNNSSKGVIMKILHTSDWHLGMSDGKFSLYDDQKAFIDEICETVRKCSIDAVLLAGDIYDHSVASADAVKLYDYAMTRLCSEIGTKVLVIAGNHDNAERLAACNTLLEKSGLIVLGQAERTPKIVHFEDTDIALLPWVTEEKVKSLYPEVKDEIKSTEDAYRVIVSDIKSHMSKGKKHIIMSHAYITDAELSDSDRAARIGTATAVSSSVFEGFDYVALGHIHKPQDVTGSIRYSGTPMAYSFGNEERQQKSVTVIDTSAMEKEIIPLHPLRCRTTIEGTREEIFSVVQPENIRNGYVKVQITDDYIGLSDISALREIYQLLVEVSGKQYGTEDASITLTMDEFEKIEKTPEDVFDYYCREEAGEEPSGHLKQLFKDAVNKCMGGSEK